MDDDQGAGGTADSAPDVVEQARLRYRDHARHRRERRGALRYTEAEWALIITAAVRHRMRPGAWAQQAALDTAAAEIRGTGAGRQEVTALIEALHAHRTALVRVGGNLNQLTAFANTTSQIPEAAAGILRRVRELVGESDELVARCHRVLAPTGGR
jgi:hypothetical protein